MKKSYSNSAKECGEEIRAVNELTLRRYLIMTSEELVLLHICYRINSQIEFSRVEL
jgi:hypothetical protein